MADQTFSFPESRPRYIRRFSRIAATASCLPERVVSNQEIIDANHLQVTDAVVRRTPGVERRRVAEEGITDSDLLAEAARRCLAKANVAPDQLSHILVTRFLGDHVLPMTASLVQRKLGCRVAMHALDIEGGINAFLHALDLAIRYISTTAEPEQHILILSGGIHTLPVSRRDPRLAFLFGDGAAAVLLSAAREPHFTASYAWTSHALQQAAGTIRLKMDRAISEQLFTLGNYEMLYDLYRMENWKDSLDFYLQAARVTRERLLTESELTPDEIDLVLLTENNARMREAILAELGVAEERSLTLLRDYGNTMSAMLPLLLDRAFAEGHIREGMNVMLISLGEGASGGGFIYHV